MGGGRRSRATVSMGGEYLVLRPERATVLDLIAMLLSSMIDARKSVDSSKRTEPSFARRFVIFVSVLVQKILLFVACPMSSCGSALEMCLNTLSLNGGLRGLLFKIFWGKVAIPDRTSRAFLSVNGNLDPRVDLDSNIIPGDGRYNGAVAIMASKAAYENKAYIETAVADHWKMKFVDSYDFWNDCVDQFTTRAFVMHNPNSNPETIIVSFRGTRPFDAYEWCSDFDISWYEIPGVGRVHAGFMEALGMQKKGGLPKELEQEKKQLPVAYYFLRKELKELLQEKEGAKFVVTGHSLGGALAILFPAILAVHKEEWLLERLEGVYTFGQPRVGDEQFALFVTGKLKEYGVKYNRYVYCNDMVPRLPADDSALLFKHFGTCLYFNSLYQGKICETAPNRNYFSPLALISMILNAVWEIIRSFFISIILGPNYREGWFLRFYRMSGLLIPGLPDHAPQDYDNSTRLAVLPF
ncbi:triacylglycerol lipase OBL1-like [Malania oleifera]|uniref:triacylglycerol lipase OBL1-like n=1 Tax=Malania oleifera TaxID=397392 RepID=UPI0025ADAF8A|nr:triacylglycerol lipase OBL1-like [Malania oleifera]